MVDQIKLRYPEVRLRPERVLVPAGVEHRLVTAGAAASWIDLALYLIARFCGEDEARRTAKLFLFGDRSDGQLDDLRNGNDGCRRCRKHASSNARMGAALEVLKSTVSR